MADRAAQLQQLYDENAAPGADAFRRLAAKKGLKVTDAEARACREPEQGAGLSREAEERRQDNGL